MQTLAETLEARRDALLDAVESINARIYEERVALELLEREVSNERDGDPLRSNSGGFA